MSIIALPANSGQWPWMSRRVTFSHHMQSIIRRYHTSQMQAWRSPKSWSGSLRVVTANSSCSLSQIITKTLRSSRISASSKFIMKTSNIYRSITRTTSIKEMTCLVIKSICICILILIKKDHFRYKVQKNRMWGLVLHYKLTWWWHPSMRRTWTHWAPIPCQSARSLSWQIDHARRMVNW